MGYFRISELRNSSVLKIYSLRDRIQTNPDYQRMGGIWNMEKRQLLIDTIINDFDIPKLYFHEFPEPRRLSNGRIVDFAIIDGRQRLETIWSFINGEFPLADDFKYLNDDSISAAGMTYADLSSKFQKLKTQVDAYSLPIMLVSTDDLDYIEEMFSRLNEAVPLNAAEKRNAMGGPLTDVIREVAQHQFFANKIPFSNNRYQYRDVTAKFLLLTDSGTTTDTKKVYLDTLVADFKNNNMIAEAKNLSLTVYVVLERMCLIFVDKDPLLKTQAMTIIYYLIFKDAIENDWIAKITRERLNAFEIKRNNNRTIAERDIAKASYELLEFDRMSLQGSNDRLNIEYRSEVLKSFLLEDEAETENQAKQIACPVCGQKFNSFINLARHMVLKERPSATKPSGGEHTLYLETAMGKPFKNFAWGMDRQISVKLRDLWKAGKLQG